MAARLRFGVYEFDSDTCELTKSGLRIRLQEQPARMLRRLLEHPGEVVTREALRQELWPSDTFVAFDNSLNTAANKIRAALLDSAANPRYLETIPKTGYRFMVPVERLELAEAVQAKAEAEEQVNDILQSPPPQPASLKNRGAVAAIAIVVLIGAAVSAMWRRGDLRETVRTESARLTIDLPPGQQLSRFGRSVAISPDASKVAYIANSGQAGRVFIRRLAEDQPHAVPGSDGAYGVTFSPEGDQVAFFANGRLKVAGPDNANPRDLVSLNAPQTGLSLTWAADGFLYYSDLHAASDPGFPRIWRVSPARPSEPVELALDIRQPLDTLYPQTLLPSGDLLVTINRGPTNKVTALRTRSGASRVLLEHATGARYTDRGELVYFWGGKLFSAPFDAASGRAGRAVEVVSGVAQDGWSGGQADVARNGTVVYIAGPPYDDRTLVWVDKAGKESAVPAPPGHFFPLDLSPDGSQLLLMKPEVYNQTWSLWMVDLHRGAWSKIAQGGGGRTAAVWTRDGKSIVYSSDAYGGSMVNLYTIAAGAAAGSERRLLEDAELGQFPQSASACGDLAYIDGTRPLPINTSIWLWRRSGKPAVVVDGPGWKLHPAISPDCNWIAYDSDITGMKEIYLKPISQPGDAIRVSNGGGNSPIWGSSMNELFYRSGDAMNRVGLRYAGNTITPGRPEKLFEGSYAPPETWSNHILRGPDGRFLMSKIHNERDTLKKIHIILNGVR